MPLEQSVFMLVCKIFEKKYFMLFIVEGIFDLNLKFSVGYTQSTRHDMHLKISNIS